MTTPITVTFQKTAASPWIDAEIRDRVQRLQLLHADIMACRVVVDIPHRRHQRGNRFAIRIEFSVPGEEVAITRDANVHGVVKDLDEGDWSKRFDVEAARRDIRLVISEAFAVAKRRLGDHAQRRRREVKRHAGPSKALVADARPAARTRSVKVARAR